MSDKDEIARLKAEVERLRGSNRQLHRRAQQAEGIIKQSGIVEKREQGPTGRSLGRALANYAAAQLQIQLDEATARAEQAEHDRNSARAELLDAAETERQLRARVAALEDELDTDAKTIAELQAERDRYAAENAELARAHAAAESDVTRLAAVVATIRHCLVDADGRVRWPCSSNPKRAVLLDALTATPDPAKCAACLWDCGDDGNSVTNCGHEVGWQLRSQPGVGFYAAKEDGFIFCPFCGMKIIRRAALADSEDSDDDHTYWFGGDPNNPQDHEYKRVPREPEDKCDRFVCIHCGARAWHHTAAKPCTRAIEGSE